MFSKKDLQFLDDLKANNNRDWFLANKTRYEDYKKNYHKLIGEFLDVMKPQDANLEMLQIKNCTFRINRDIRFSHDKTPYKTHAGIWMSTNSSYKNPPGYYIHIENGKSFIAGGLYCPEAAELKLIRKEIDFFHDDLEKIVKAKSFTKYYSGLDVTESNALKNAPKGFEKDHPAIEFLKLKSFTTTNKIDNAALLNGDFVKATSEKLLALKPLLDFLNRGLSAD